MPLGCDCYDGCWGDHSINWPKVANAATAYSYWRQAQNSLPYGTYVMMEDHLRVETQELADKLTTIMRNNVS